MKLYKGYSLKDVNPFWVATYTISIGRPVSNSYTVSLSTKNKLVAILYDFNLFPELATQIPIGISNETI